MTDYKRKKTYVCPFCSVRENMLHKFKTFSGNSAPVCPDCGKGNAIKYVLGKVTVDDCKAVIAKRKQSYKEMSVLQLARVADRRAHGLPWIQRR